MALSNSSFKEQVQLLSKIATSDGHSEKSPYFDAWKAYDRDPYHSISNPQGVIQMGLAENQVCKIIMRVCLKMCLHIEYLTITIYTFGSFPLI